MKRIVVLFLLLVLTFMFFACEEDDAILDISNYGAEFRAENDNLFPNDSCEHLIVAKDVSNVLTPEEARFYHLCVCKYGNCDYETYYAPHVLRWSLDDLDGISRATYAENGYLYHTLIKSCIECHFTVYVKIYCEKQDVNCGAGEAAVNMPTECLAADRDWKEIFRDFPYKIEISD